MWIGPLIENGVPQRQAVRMSGPAGRYQWDKLSHAAQFMIDTTVNQICKIWPSADRPLARRRTYSLVPNYSSQVCRLLLLVRTIEIQIWFIQWKVGRLRARGSGSEYSLVSTYSLPSFIFKVNFLCTYVCYVNGQIVCSRTSAQKSSWKSNETICAQCNKTVLGLSFPFFFWSLKTPADLLTCEYLLSANDAGFEFRYEI